MERIENFKSESPVIEESPQPLLSICVPTFKRPEILRQMLQSILSQNVDSSLYNICITDNSPTDETKELIDGEFSHIPNLFYKKTFCEGFLNSVEALKFGTGKLLKLHNDYSLFLPGALAHMLAVAKEYQPEQPVLFFSMKSLRNTEEITTFEDYNSFQNNIHYYSTWSSSFSIWKDDFDSLKEKLPAVNHMYPHTSLLHWLSDKKKYVVDNYAYVENLTPKKKGGYNLVDNFVRIYLTMVREDLLNRGIITEETYHKIETNIIHFCAYWQAVVQSQREVYTFTFDHADAIIRSVCGEKMVIFYHYRCLRENLSIQKEKFKKA